MNIYPCKLTWSIFDALFRAHGICNIVSVATKSLSATDYYPYCPMVGPILAGCLIGNECDICIYTYIYVNDIIMHKNDDNDDNCNDDNNDNSININTNVDAN